MDPISDMIIQIKNAGEAGKSSLSVPYSKLKLAIAEVLQKEGYIKSVSTKGKKVTKALEIELLYKDNDPRIKDVKRISKNSKRVYQRNNEIKPVRHGYGTLLLSTPKGILTDKSAKKEGVGGEALFAIW